MCIGTNNFFLILIQVCHFFYRNSGIALKNKEIFYEEGDAGDVKKLVEKETYLLPKTWNLAHMHQLSLLYS